MANNEDVNQAQGAPAADIPDLKKKEKERKKAGAGWSGAKPGGGSFSGATGGTVARAAASAAGSAGGAAAQAAGAGWLSSTIATLTATVLGKAILAAGVAAFLAGAGLFGYAMFHGGTAATGDTGDLGAISSSMKVRTNGSDRTGYVASNGEIMFDPLKKAEAKKEPEKAPEEKTAGDAVPPTQGAGAGAGEVGKAQMNRAGLDHNLSGTKLSSSLGGGFGGKNIFSGNSGAPKLNDGLAKMSIKGAQKGTLSAGTRKAQTGRLASGSSGRGGKSSKAFGQLRVAKGMSMLGAGTSGAEGSRAAAANAFDGSNDSGNVEGSAGPQKGAVDSPSSPNGAPDMTAPNVDTPNGVAAGPDIAQALAGIGDLAKAAGEMKKMGMMMMALGVILAAIGIKIMTMGFPWCIAIGAVILAIGLMLVAMGKMMLDQSEQMKAMAEQMGDALAARTGDIKQNEINKYCIDKAYQGTDPKNCNPPDSVTENSRINAQDKKALGLHNENAKKADTIKEIDPTEGLNGKPTGQ